MFCCEVVMPGSRDLAKNNPGRKGREKASRNRAQIGLRLVIPELHLALIHQNTALLFWESRYLKSVWLSGVVSQRKITANSTYWEAKVRARWASGWVGVPRGKKGLFWHQLKSWSKSEKPFQGHTPRYLQFGL